MNDPYIVFGLDASADDDAIRQRYLQLVRENPPERAPDRFAEIHAAYEQLRDVETSWERRLFLLKESEPVETVIERRLSDVARPRYATSLLL